MSNIVVVKPLAGRRVLDPAAEPPTPLPVEGRRVVADSYWLRRQAAGEVTIEVPAGPSGVDGQAGQGAAVAPGKGGKARKPKTRK